MHEPILLQHNDNKVLRGKQVLFMTDYKIFSTRCMEKPEFPYRPFSLKKLELLSATPRATFTLLSCSSNFPHASITRCTHAKHEPILNCPNLKVKEQIPFEF